MKIVSAKDVIVAGLHSLEETLTLGQLEGNAIDSYHY